MNTNDVTEVTELAGQQSLFRELIRSAFVARLGDVQIDFDFHRGWNGGWKCRAQISGKAPLEFALLRTSGGELLTFPVPFPVGWRRYGVLDSSGVAWTVREDGVPTRVGG